MIKNLDTWPKTKLALLTRALVGLALAYGFASAAIDRGNVWWYLLTVIFLTGFLQNLCTLGARMFGGVQRVAER